MRKFTIKKLFALLLIPIVLFMAIYCPSPAVYADSIIDDLVYYGLTVSGYMRMQYGGSGGGGHSFGSGINPDSGYTQNKTIFQNLVDAVTTAYENRDINVDTSGNITFNQNATKNFYTVLNAGGLGGYSAVLLGSNNSFSDLSGSPYVNGTYYNSVQECYSLYPNGLYMAWQSRNREENSSQSVNFVVYDMSDVAYCAISNNSDCIEFYSASNSSISVNYKLVSSSSYSWGSTVNNAVVKNGTTDHTLTLANLPTAYSGDKNCYIGTSNDLTIEKIISAWNTLIRWYGDSTSYSTTIKFSCPNGVIIGSNEANARGAYNWSKEPDYICPKIFDVFPPINSNQYNNTNFKDSYNTYVTNVNNNYNNLDNPEFDIKEFEQIAKDQNQIILNAINQGVENITGVIQDTNQKLDTIIGLLMHIRDMLQEFDSGGGSSDGGSLSAEQINQLLNDLAYIKNNILTTTTFQNSMDDVQNALDDIQTANEDNYDQLVDINNNLVDIYNALIGQGGTTQNNYYYGDNYYINNYHNNNKNMDDFIDDAQDSFDDSVIDAMKGVVPFVFIIMAGSLFEKLATDPEAPHFEIPFKIDSFGIDESIEIDLANYGAIHDVLDLGWCMLLIAALMVVTFKALYLVASTFF